MADDKTMSFKASSVEVAEIEQSAKIAGVSTAKHMKTAVLSAVRGEKAVAHDDLTWLREIMERLIVLQLEHLRLTHELTAPPRRARANGGERRGGWRGLLHLFSDPIPEDEPAGGGPVDEAWARKHAAEQVTRTLQRLGMEVKP